LLALWSNALEHKYSVRSSTLIFGLYLVFLSALAIHIRTLLLLANDSDTFELNMDKVIFGLLSMGFVVEAWPRGSTVVQRSSPLPVYDKANIFMQMTFYFWQPVISLSVKRSLTLDDIANTLPENIRANVAYDRFEWFWDRAVERSNALKEKNRKKKLQGSSHLPAQEEEEKYNPWLFGTAMRVLLKYIPALFLYRLARVVAQFSVPAILSYFLAYLQDIQSSNDNNESEGPTLTYGLFLVFGMFFGSLVCTMLTFSSRQHCIKVGMQVRSALISAVYRKALCLSPGSRSKATTGEISKKCYFTLCRVT
jgi:ATP-binding cassette subfamily C (CFTR/MRP) protein 1